MGYVWRCYVCDDNLIMCIVYLIDLGVGMWRSEDLGIMFILIMFLVRIVFLNVFNYKYI